MSPISVEGDSRSSSPSLDGQPGAKSPGTRQVYVCDICGAQLSRSAHLQRHRKVHFNRDSESYTCPLCAKSFGRKDVYQRHRRIVHEPVHTPKRNGRKKSCRRCIKYKIRCTRELPCAACGDQPNECIYDGWSATTGPSGTPGNHDKATSMVAEPKRAAGGPLDQSSAALDNLARAASCLDHSSTVPERGLHADVQANRGAFVTRRESRFTTSPPTSPQSGAEHRSIRDQDIHDFTLDQGPNPNDFGGIDSYGVAFFREIPCQIPPDNRHQRSESLLHDRSQETYCVDPELEVLNVEAQNTVQPFDFTDWEGLRASRMDWLGCETEPSDYLGSTTSPGGFHQPLEHQEAEGIQLQVPYDTITPSSNITSAESHGSSGSRSENPHSISCESPQVTEDKQWPGVLDRGGNEAWPFDYTSNKGFRKIRLPPLKQILEQTVGDRPSIQKSTLKDLIKVLSAPQIPCLNDTPALEAMPAVAFLGEFAKIYFAEFHAVLPVIHIPTWRIERCSTALLAAIACIGATYSAAESSSEVSALLAEITQRALFWMGQQDSTAYRNPEYITATCFHQMYSLGSGNRRLYEIADASRGLLLTCIRGLGVLSPEVDPTADPLPSDLRQLKKLSPEALDALWLSWRDKETEKRITWAVFEFDCTISTMTSKRAAFRIAELPSRLPCAESIWEAHSAQAWAAILPFAASPPAGLPFYSFLRDIIAGKPVAPGAPAWAKRICALTIARMLHDMCETEDVAAQDVLGLRTLAAAQQETKKSLLACFEVLHESLARPTSTSDIVNMNIGSLSLYHAYLSCQGHEATDLVVFIFRNTGQHESTSCSSSCNSNHQQSSTMSRQLAAAKERLRYVFGGDPIGARRLACQAAAIVGIARECTINTPCETMRVFMAFAFLLAFNKFFPFSSSPLELAHQDDLPTEPVRLDEIPWARWPESTRFIEQWIDLGGPASVDTVADICDPANFPALKQAALDTLRTLRVWGLARKFWQTISKFT